MNGVSLSFTNWRPGEPNNHKNNEDCVDFEYQATAGQCDWNDFSCSRTEFRGRRFRPICKQEQTEREEDSPIEGILEDLMEILDPNGPITTPVATIGVLGKVDTL